MVFNEKADSGASDMILVNPKILQKSDEKDSKEVLAVINASFY